jgi:hypothetical protein
VSGGWPVSNTRSESIYFDQWLISLRLSGRMSKESRDAAEPHARFHRTTAEV